MGKRKERRGRRERRRRRGRRGRRKDINEEKYNSREGEIIKMINSKF